MNILLVTQKVDIDDPILGFMHEWIFRLASKLETMHVVTLQSGTYSLPDNVFVHSICKNGDESRIIKSINFARLFNNIFFNSKIDIVFTHMCPIYAILASLWCKLYKVPLIMWHAHATTNLTLSIAHCLVSKVLTSSFEGYPLTTNKVIVIGQGIDIEKFKFLNRKDNIETIHILTAGRISKVKGMHTLIKAIHILVSDYNYHNLQFVIAGVPINHNDMQYFDHLHKYITEHSLGKYIKFVGAISNNTMPIYYNDCDIFISGSNTGSLDKVILEAMACKTFVITCNNAFKPLFGNLNNFLFFESDNYEMLAQKIDYLIKMDVNERNNILQHMREIILKDHSLTKLIDNIITEFNNTINKNASI